MSTNLELFQIYKESTQAEFDAWNEKQPETRKIHTRLPFTVKFPKVKFLDFENKPYTDKTTGVSGINKFKRMKFPNSQGQDVAAKVQSPSVISPRGYALMKTTKGDFNTILIVYDMENPDHRCFCESIDNDITLPAVHEILKTPAEFGANINAIPIINDTVLASKEYEFGVYGIKQSMAKVLNFPKTAAGFDLKSPLRTVFLSPLFFQDPEKPDDPPAEMTVYIKTDANSPPFIVTPDELMQICDGYKGMVDSKIIKGDKKGFECGPEINFQKLNAGSKASTKFSCSSITITRFQAAPKNNSQEEKIKYLDTIGASDEYSIQMGMDDLLAGLRGASVSSKNIGLGAAIGNTFDPMGGVKSQMPPAIDHSTSLVSEFCSSSPDIKINIDSSIPVKSDISQMPPPVFGGIQQQLPNPSFGLANPMMTPMPFGQQNPMTIPGMQMPSMAIGGSSIDVSQQSFSDRLQMFNKQNTGL